MHFLLIGAALWGIRELTREDAEARPPIVIDEAFVAGLERQHVQATGRPPEDVGLLVDDYVREEVLFREALRLGLERDDPIVRRRLVQKMELLLAAAAEPEEPSDEALRAHLSANAERFVRPGRVGFEQIVFTTGRREDPAADAAAALEQLGEGAEPTALGDAFPLGRSQPAADREALAGRYGAELAGAVFAVEGEGWAGPFASPFGAHLVRVNRREPGRTPALDEVREAVERDWRREQRDARVAEAIGELVNRAEVVRP